MTPRILAPLPPLLDGPTYLVLREGGTVVAQRIDDEHPLEAPTVRCEPVGWLVGRSLLLDASSPLRLRAGVRRHLGPMGLRLLEDGPLDHHGALTHLLVTAAEWPGRSP
jgi:hypothetical protein